MNGAKRIQNQRYEGVAFAVISTGLIVPGVKLSRKSPAWMHRVSKKEFFGMFKHNKGGTRTLLLGFDTASKLENNTTKIILYIDKEWKSWYYEKAAVYVEGHEFLTDLAVSQTPYFFRPVEKSSELIDVRIVKKRKSNNKGWEYWLVFQEQNRPMARIKRIALYESYIEVDEDYGKNDEIFKSMGIIDNDGDYLYQEERDEEDDARKTHTD